MNPDFLDILVFSLDGQRHGVPVAEVQELLPALAIMPVPNAGFLERGFEGVINLRGGIVPVLSLRRRFGMPVKGVALTDHFIVLRLHDRLTAVHVDQALELARLDPAAIADVDTVDAREAGARVAKVGDGLILLHRAQDLLALASQRNLTEIGPTPARAAEKEVGP
ncbi:MAG: purine-binding chemotaxis protein CheW [Planctomycetes bacterium]|nr:purine-binding chemotaxis protein CheW [Planctomycetota bacterium]